ncbi:MAG TPA: cytochrome C [Mucilaginibacter sp.]|jgi:mono/diheme cytochrome c family protein|nr:cytochrome C [Mucilaginibacter sp.]
MKLRKGPLLLLLTLFIATGIYAQVKQVKKTVHYPGSAAAMARGKIVYTNICLACHMADGGGVQNMNPPLISTSYVSGNKPALIKIVLNGFKDDVEINGQKYSNNMLPHSDLSDQQVADVLTYVRKSFGNKASAVTAFEVKKVRALIKN